MLTSEWYAALLSDRETGRVRGFGFVGDSEADAAISALDGQTLGDRSLRVNLARPRESRCSSFGGGGNGRVDTGERR